ncbi:MAG TPA: L,D-transpeptidase family protein [Ilumatobacteraceae bacterium]
MSPSRRPSKPPPPVARWLPAIAAVVVLAIVVVAAGLGGGSDKAKVSAETVGTDAVSPSAVGGTSGGTDPSDSYGVTGLTEPASTLPGDSATLPDADKTPITRSLYQGENGADVKALQVRLASLGFVPGPTDGQFGELTKEAVWAFEKLILGTPSAKATGKVTKTMWLRMQDPIVIAPRRPGSGTHVEIYLPQQVAAVFTDNKATLVIHISSGMAITPDRTPDNEWCDTIQEDTDANGNAISPPVPKAVCGVAFTPGGVFRFTRELQGDHVGPLGGMYNPVYFNYGIAMHGAMNVPLTPASHGCIRMNKTISNTFQNYVQIHDLVYVWGWDGKQPEDYTKAQRSPVFNFNDPNATTTTSTTTTVKATTTSSATKVTTTTTKPTSTTAKPTTTTSTTVKTTTTTSTTVKETPTTQPPPPTNPPST